MHTPFSVSRLVWRLGLLVSLFALLIGYAGVAHADPLARATDAANSGVDLLKQYGPIWGGMALIYGLWSQFLVQNKSTHWIAEGRTLAMIVAAAGVLASVLQTHFNGGQWSGVIATAVIAGFKLVKPTVQPATTATPAPASSQGGFAARRVMYGMAVVAIAGLLVVDVAACSWTKQEAKTVATDFVDCTKGEKATAVKLFSPILVQLLALAIGGDGKLDKTQAESATRSLVGDIGGCVASDAFAKVLAPPASGSGAPQSSPLAIDRDEARAYFESLRASKFGGAHYMTEAGPL